MPPSPLSVADLHDLHEWVERVVADANGWAERAETSRDERSCLTMHLDAIASRARHVASLTSVLTDK